MKTNNPHTNSPALRLLTKLSLFAFKRSRLAAVFWLCLTLFGVLSYTTFMKREGFPSVNVPFSVISGAYLVNDPQKVDQEVTKPISDLVLTDKRVATVQSTARGTFYTVVAQYKEGTNAPAVGRELEKRIADAKLLPAQASIKIATPKFGFTQRGDDAVISLYSVNGSRSTKQLVAEGEKLAAFITGKKLPTVADISVIDPFVKGVDPATGMLAASQTAFDRYGVRTNQSSTFYDSVAVGASQQKGTDSIEFDNQLRAALTTYNAQQKHSSFHAVVSASYAPQIKEQVGELQRALLEGLLAVLVIGSLIIAIRASLITVLAMLTVLSITLGLLFLIGYSLNTITLFALILCLALIVDDTIIMIEAIDAQRRRRKDPQETIQVATSKISKAMVAATSTAVLSFTPLLFVGGILGGFIRAIPVTVISSLIISLLVALVFIPVFSRYLLLGKKQMGEKNVHEPAAGIEARIAHFISRPMLWARNSTKKLLGVGLIAVFVGLIFIGAAGYLFQKVTFNIFPPTKDTNGLVVELRFPAGSSIEDALKAAQQTDAIAAQTLGDNFKQASYYATGTAQSASLFIGITPYTDRDIRSPQMVEQLKTAYATFNTAIVSVHQQDVGPPSSPFTVRIQTADRPAATKLAKDMQGFLQGKQLTRLSGQKATVTTASISDPNTYDRADGASYLQVTATFDGDDTSTLVTLAKTAVEKQFTPQTLQTYGLSADALKFDFGQESENQDSFKSLAIAFPIVLAVIYLLLALQFRSLAQPLLIFMAIPFSLFGITLGLFTTGNPFSFFAMLGFFALIGLSLKNTILLTDYANQQRRAGVRAVDAAVEALSERFRPLIATSLTAVVSLIPLAFMSPFWEGLAVVLICGLLSSTLLVILVFPYYYLGVEFMRAHISRKGCLLWLGLTVAAGFGLNKLGVNLAFVPLVSAAIAFAQWGTSKRRRSAKP